MNRLVRAVLRRVVPGDWADDVIRDLEEAHRQERARRGRLLAGLWLVWQATAFALRFGRERVREAYGSGPGRTLDLVVQDARLTLRSAGRSPLFFVAAVVTLGVGIGATSAIFSMVRTVLLDPLPYPDADQLAVLDPYPWIPAEALEGLDRKGAGVETLAGFYPHRFSVTADGRPMELEGAVVTPDLLDLLDAEIELGRGFGPGDARSGAPATAILSHEGWQRLFGGSPEVLGRSVRLDGRPHEVVGVLAPDFRQLTPRTEAPAVWTPAALDRLSAHILEEGSPPWAIPVARLGANARAVAQAELEAAASRFVEGDPEMATSRRWRELRWRPLHAELTEEAREPLLLLQAAVALVLLLACANVANLLLVRSASRRTELALRSALGASRSRVLGQLVTEGVVISLVGGGIGLAVAFLSLNVLVAAAPAGIPRLDEAGVDAATVTFAIAVSLLTGILLGILPGLAGIDASPAGSLKEGSRTTGGSRRRRWTSQALVVGEVTVTLVLLVSAGLLVRSFTELAGEDPGFHASGVVAVPLSADRARYGDVPALSDYQARLLARAARSPGVESVAIANNLPHQRVGARRSVVVEGEGAPREVHYAVVSPGYFQTLGIPLERGRPLRASDTRDAPAVAIIDRAMADRIWPGTGALGQRFRFEDDERWITVVGVSADVRGAGLAATPEPGFHIPYTQRPRTAVELAVGRHMVLLARLRRGAPDPGSLLRAAIWEVDDGQPVPEVTRLESLLKETTGPERFRALLVGIFAALALVMAVVGIYGVVAQLVGERRHELGVRKALGATAGDLLRDVLGWGLKLTGTGLVLGLVGVFLATRLLAGLLYGVGATDPATVAGAVATVLVVTLAACLVPAFRAARADALITLRRE